MRLHVSLIDHIEPDLIAELIEQRCIGIMRRTDSVNVMPLHLKQILTHLLYRCHVARVRIAVMTVDAADL